MQIPAGEFKAKCLRLMERVSRSREEIVITKRGIPVAKLVPLEAKDRTQKFILGCMKGTGKTLGDIVSPTGEVWDAER